MKRHLVSFLLVLVMVIGMIPCIVCADDTSETGEYGDFVDGDQVISALIDKCGANTHPRIILTEEKFASLRSHIGDGSVTADLLEELRGEANGFLEEEYVPVYDAYGDDHLLETSKKIQRAVATLAMAYHIFGGNEYALRAYIILKAACNFQDWSPKHFLDTAEMCTAFAFGYDWLYHWLNPDQRALLRKNMIEKGLMQIMQDYTDDPADRARTYRWYQDTRKWDNWQLVCTGGTNLAALAIADEKGAREICAKVLTYGYKRAYSFVRHAYSIIDGTYTEGLGYWDYATYYLGLQSSALISTTGTDYGLADYEGVRKSVDFIRGMSSNTPTSFSFGDDHDSRNTGWTVFLWLGEYFNSPEMSALRLRNINVDPEFRYLDVVWIDESKQTGEQSVKDTDWGVVGASNASFRTSWDKSGMVTALHTGENIYDYHEHYDLGSFYLESNGSRFFTDLGNENYKLVNRMYSYRIKAEGHNTLVINPTEGIDQREGANCLITDFQSGNTAYAVTDLTDAYTPSGANKVIRGLKMIKDKKCVIVRDEISLDKPGEIYWFAHTTGQISVAGDGKSAIVTVGSDRLWVGLTCENGRFTVMNAEPLPTSLNVPGASNNSKYRKLAVHLTNTKDTTISVVCIPLKTGETKPSWTPTVDAISEWSGESDLGEKLYGCNVSLSGDIGMNFYMDLSSAVLSEDAYLEFTVPSGDKTTTRKVYVQAKAGEERAVADVVTKDGKTYYVFKCQVSAKDFASPIGMQMSDNGKHGKKYSYSVKEYADYLIAHKNDNAEYKKAAPFVGSLVCYCTWAQTYFGINSDLIDRTCLNYDTVSSVTIQELKAAAPVSSVNLQKIPGVKFEGSTLSLKSETTLSLYFSSSEQLTFSCRQGNRLETTTVDGYQVVRIRGIAAHELDRVFQIKVICGGKEGTVSYSAMNYIYDMVSRTDTDETWRNTVKAMYLYYKAAQDYI